MDPRIPPTDLSEREQQPITAFIQQSPNSTYTLNETHKDAPVMELCRLQSTSSNSSSRPTATAGGQYSSAQPNGRQCIQVDQQVTKVFAHLVKQGFFCQLPFDPTKTEIECIRINKIVERQTPK